jgi:hypothetical protein
MGAFYEAPNSSRLGDATPASRVAGSTRRTFEANEPRPGYRLPTVTVKLWSSNDARDENPEMMRRRRPLRRAAVVGGVAVAAHHAGTRSAEAQAAEQAQNEQIADLQAQQAAPQQAPPQYAPPPVAEAAPEVGGADMVTQLQNLKKLLDEGVLTQAEFDMEKQKLLASS